MEQSERTKRRKIAAKVVEHLRLVSQQNESDHHQDLIFCSDSFENKPLVEEYHDCDEHAGVSSQNEQSADIFYDALDFDVFPEDSESGVSEFNEFDLDDDCFDSDAFSDTSDDTKGLAEWAAEYNVSHNALSALLKILRQKGLDVPLDARTLMSTARKCNVINVAGGSYYHFGLKNSIAAALELLDFDLKKLTNNLTLRINVDGLPLFRSNNVSLWPILGGIKEIPNCDVFVIGLYSGTTKPSNVQEYLNDFVQDVRAIIQDGVQYNGVHFSVAAPDAFICDAPARAFLKCVKGHTGYYACERCTQKGMYVNRRLCFPEISAEQRTDETFRAMAYKEHQVGVSPLNELGVGLVSGFVLDYMHLVCLGVMRKLIYLWLKGPRKCRQSMQILTVISAFMVSVRQYLPKCFARKPRSLLEISMWKATELRQFLLYTGPVVLFNNIPSQMYRHFILLSVSIRILLSPDLCIDNCDYADDVLKQFVKDFGLIYGLEFVGYNVHNLIHLAEDARKSGPLDSISCFPFETFLGKLKKIVRRPHKPVEQIVKCVYEMQSIQKKRKERMSVPSPLKQPHNSGPITSDLGTFKQYRKYTDGQTYVSCSMGDNCFNVGGKILIVANILQDCQVVKALCQVFENCNAFFSYPLDSTCLGIYFVSNLSKQMHLVLLDELKQKIVLLPLKSGYVALPLLY
ncbi:unnamed protein product [Oreochromis niloticus]|nr:unnamed protein product [Mustela putorius furo]